MGGIATKEVASVLAVRKIAETGRTLSKSQQRAIRSYEKRISEHRQKLNAYKKDPGSFDNKGLLKNAPNDKIRQDIINGRIKHLKSEIRTFQKNIKKIRR